MLCSSDKIVGQCEIRPGGMLVQKRNSDANDLTSRPIPIIRVRVKYGSSYRDIYISSQASFGELKKKLAESTGLHPEEQKLIFKDKERESEVFLDTARVKDGSKIVLFEDMASRERRWLEKHRKAKAEKVAELLAEIGVEVDKLQGQIERLESVACRGRKATEIGVDNLIEILMAKLIQLDGIVAEGDLKIQRRMQVRRVQKHIEALDVLKLRIAARNGRDYRRESSIGDELRPPRQPLMKHSESVVVTTKWETFE